MEGSNVGMDDTEVLENVHSEPVGIPNSRDDSLSPTGSASSSVFSGSANKWAPHTFEPSTVSSSYRTRSFQQPHSYSAGHSHSGYSRHIGRRQKREVARSPAKRSLLSSLLATQQSQPSHSTAGLSQSPTGAVPQPSSSAGTSMVHTPSHSGTASSGQQLSSHSQSYASMHAFRGDPSSVDSKTSWPDSQAYAPRPSSRIQTPTTYPQQSAPPTPTGSLHAPPGVFYHGTSTTNVTHTSVSAIPTGPYAVGTFMPALPPKGSVLLSHRSIDIATHSVPDMLEMIALVLQEILSQNDVLYPPDARGHPLPSPPVRNEDGAAMRSTLLSFHGCIIPAISQRAYLSRILKYCPLTNEVFIALLVYFDRISRYAESYTHPDEERPLGCAPHLFVLDSYNVHRLIIAGVTVASKFFSDIFYKNSRYAQVGGLPVDELNSLELQFLILINFNLMVTVEEFQTYANFIQEFYLRTQEQSSKT